MAIDRVFSIKGRGTVVTGSLRGGRLRRNAALRLVPGGASLRARELQVHGRAVDEAGPGRTAVNVTGAGADTLRRGMVLTDDPAVVTSDRLLVRLARPLPDRSRVRLHLGTASVDGTVGRSGRDAIELAGGVAAVLRLAEPMAAAAGDRFVVRPGSGVGAPTGGSVLDPIPPRGISRRRQTPERVGRLAEAVAGGREASIAAARLGLHGAARKPGIGLLLADDVAEAGIREILAVVSGEASLAAVRAFAARTLRRNATLRGSDADSAASLLVDRLVTDGRLTRDGDRLLAPGRASLPPALPDPVLLDAMERVERALDVFAPPSLSAAAVTAGCPPAGIGELERSGRIVVLDDDLAYATATHRQLEQLALDLAGRTPLTPAALRDATGTSRKYVMAILADLDRRGILRRTEAGHVTGPRAPSVATPGGARVDDTVRGTR